MSPAIAQDAHLLAERLAGAGFSIQKFDTTGTGGIYLESAIRSGVILAVVELALDDLVDGRSGVERMTAAAIRGTPQVIAPVCYPTMSPRQADLLGKELAHKASAARGPVAVFLPNQSQNSTAEIVAASVRLWIAPNVTFELIDEVNRPSAVADWIISAV